MSARAWPVCLRKAALTVASATLLAACAPGSMTTRADNAATSTSDTDMSKPPSAAKANCDAAPAQVAVGRRGTPELAETARQQAGATTVRLLQHGQVTTREYLANRLTLQLDEGGFVVRVSCG